MEIISMHPNKIDDTHYLKCMSQRFTQNTSLESPSVIDIYDKLSVFSKESCRVWKRESCKMKGNRF